MGSTCLLKVRWERDMLRCWLNWKIPWLWVMNHVRANMNATRTSVKQAYNNISRLIQVKDEQVLQYYYSFVFIVSIMLYIYLIWWVMWLSFYLKLKASKLGCEYSSLTRTPSTLLQAPNSASGIKPIIEQTRKEVNICNLDLGVKMPTKQRIHIPHKQNQSRPMTTLVSDQWKWFKGAHLWIVYFCPCFLLIF